MGKRYKNLNKEEKLNWILERIEESPTGSLYIRRPLRNKFRELTNDFTSSEFMIELKIINKYNEKVG